MEARDVLRDSVIDHQRRPATRGVCEVDFCDCGDNYGVNSPIGALWTHIANAHLAALSAAGFTVISPPPESIPGTDMVFGVPLPILLKWFTEHGPEHGYTLVRTDQLAEAREALALARSMVLAGEKMTDQSTAVIEQALAVLRGDLPDQDLTTRHTTVRTD